MAKLVGGESSKPVTEFKHGFVHDGVKTQVFRISKQEYERYRILPARNDLLQDTKPKEWATSFVPFKDRDGKDTDWYFYVKGYTFVGNGQRQFLSPLNTIAPDKRKYAKGVDPLRDCFSYVYKTQDTELIQRLTKSDGNKSPVIPGLRDFALMNVVGIKDGEASSPMIGIASKVAMEDLFTQLMWRLGRGDEELSQAFDDLLFGDITDPMNGLTLKVIEKVMSSGAIKYAGFQIATKEMTQKGITKFPIDPSSSEGMDILSNRYNIGDTDEVTYIPTYQEILNYIVEDGSIPYDVIFEACGNYADVPQPSKKVKVFSPSKAAAPASSRANVSSAVPVSDDDADDEDTTTAPDEEAAVDTYHVNEDEDDSGENTEDPEHAEYLSLKKEATSPETALAFFSPKNAKTVTRYMALVAKFGEE